MSETIDLLGANGRNCRLCNVDISDKHGKRIYCDECNEHCNGLRDAQRREKRAENEMLNQIAIDHWLRLCNRGRAFSTFGKHDPLDEVPHISVRRIKDKTSQAPLGVDIHLEPRKPKIVDGVTAHSEGEYQAQHTRALKHALTMPRTNRNFCAVCVEVIMDREAKKIRITKGVYLPIEHECNSVRVYNLQGNLIEVKAQ